MWGLIQMEGRITESPLRVTGTSMAGYSLQWGRGQVLVTYLCQHWARYWDSRVHCLRESGKDSHEDSSSAET